MNVDLNGGFILFVVGQLGVTVYGAGIVHANLRNLVREIKELKDEMKSIHSVIFTRSDVERELSHIDREHRALHQRIDKLEERVFAPE